MAPSNLSSKLWLNISDAVATVITIVLEFYRFKFIVFKEVAGRLCQLKPQKVRFNIKINF